jgi:hypothetical protein
MKIKRQQQKTPTTKKLDSDLDTFLHSIICLPIKDLNKYFIFILGNTNNVIFSLNNFLKFDSINSYYLKSRVFSRMNGMIVVLPETRKFRSHDETEMVKLISEI